MLVDTLNHRTYTVSSGRLVYYSEVVATINAAVPGAHIGLPDGRNPDRPRPTTSTPTRLQTDTCFRPGYDVAAGRVARRPPDCPVPPRRIDRGGHRARRGPRGRRSRLRHRRGSRRPDVLVGAGRRGRVDVVPVVWAKGCASSAATRARCCSTIPTRWSTATVCRTCTTRSDVDRSRPGARAAGRATAVGARGSPPSPPRSTSGRRRTGDLCVCLGKR
jgi:hypothetical protein